ncbi:hypothetical protein BLNAU_7453 [Blattamonas nauphoetae]|uniref:Uncharacterized protein n=1 Tax=Blattamonas nauphoetae TaxID=2049346 RepID=A0ABQ9Y1E0_9EUKA|nr:hypothetical protein BLNAU_7453 [Blattamonas nauphoetae]
MPGPSFVPSLDGSMSKSVLNKKKDGIDDVIIGTTAATRNEDQQPVRLALNCTRWEVDTMDGQITTHGMNGLRSDPDGRFGALCPRCSAFLCSTKVQTVSAYFGAGAQPPGRQAEHRCAQLVAIVPSSPNV